VGGAALSPEGQVAVVTGGVSGIGAAIAQGLEQDGATVEIFDLELGRYTAIERWLEEVWG
jgi:NAD(P)-dependent dehydrogenase (short-subunit alcohol dehydrogenase family)